MQCSYKPDIPNTQYAQIDLLVNNFKTKRKPQQRIITRHHFLTVRYKTVGCIIPFSLTTVFVACWQDGVRLTNKLLSYWHQRIFKYFKFLWLWCKWQEQNHWLARPSGKENCHSHVAWVYNNSMLTVLIYNIYTLELKAGRVFHFKPSLRSILSMIIIVSSNFNCIFCIGSFPLAVLYI